MSPKKGKGDIDDLIEEILVVYRELAKDESRNRVILSDVIASLREGRSPIVLTERRDQSYFDTDSIDASVRKLTHDLDLGIQLEGEIATASLPRSNFLNLLMSSPSARASVFSGKKVHLNEHLADAPIEHEGLTTVFVTAPEEDVLNRLIDFLRHVAVVDREIHIEAPDMLLLGALQQKLGDPTTYEHNLVAILPEEMRQLDEHRASRCHGCRAVVVATYH